MFMACGVGAFVIGIFHMSPAFFKAQCSSAPVA